jgi:hypothetical protein
MIVEGNLMELGDGTEPPTSGTATGDATKVKPRWGGTAKAVTTGWWPPCPTGMGAGSCLG